MFLPIVPLLSHSDSSDLRLPHRPVTLLTPLQQFFQFTSDVLRDTLLVRSIRRALHPDLHEAADGFDGFVAALEDADFVPVRTLSAVLFY